MRTGAGESREAEQVQGMCRVCGGLAWWSGSHSGTLQPQPCVLPCLLPCVACKAYENA